MRALIASCVIVLGCNATDANDFSRGLGGALGGANAAAQQPDSNGGCTLQAQCASLPRGQCLIPQGQSVGQCVSAAP